MSYTATDLIEIRAAIKKFALGTRVGEVIVNNRKVKYADTTMSELRTLEKDIAASLSAPTRPRYSQIITYKGL